MWPFDTKKKELLILRLLADNGKMRGMELVERAAGKLGRGTIYVHLDRLEDAAQVGSAEVPGVAGGLPQREYWITSAGRAELGGMPFEQELNLEDQKRFAAALLDPPEPNEALRKAFRLYKTLIKPFRNGRP
jgi:DNA-binding PadR family transcriptional regulator